ncbi:MAG TPA: hypothetical protein VLB79_11300 [Solirubrobacterales bacterium]|nr:hypothetical protein [Solirubrobacterales bacterium]
MSMRSFDPVRVGELECTAWVAYYQRRWPAFLRASFGLTRESFGLSWPATLRGGWWVLRANQAWAPYPDNDPDRARVCMRRFYELVTEHSGEDFDPAEAARLEVEWWRAHRELQHDGEEADDRELVQALAALYSYVYSVPHEAVRVAAEQRAAAMAHSDRWVNQGRDPASPLIAEERAALVRSYEALREAVGRRVTQSRSPRPA